jgi:hypothetical protein
MLVLDAAVILAATRSDAGASRQLVMAALGNRFELLLAVLLALEYEAVLKRRAQPPRDHGTGRTSRLILTDYVACAFSARLRVAWALADRPSGDHHFDERCFLPVGQRTFDGCPAVSKLCASWPTPRPEGLSNAIGKRLTALSYWM